MGDETRRAGPAGQRDLTAGPITRTLFLFSLPTLGASVLQSLNGSINTFWVGRFLGEGALAATSNANIIMFLMFALSFGFGMAVTIMVGQAIGARDVAAARRAMGTGLGLFAILSVAVGVLGWLAAPALLRLLATAPEVHAPALAYLRVIFLGLPPMMLGQLIGMGLRGAGDATTPLIFNVATVVLDVLLNPVLILGLGPAPRMGIAGAATATLFANTAVLVAMIAYIYRRDLLLRLRGAELRWLVPDPALLRPITVKGVPMGLQMLVMSLSGLIMIGLINRLGVATAAAYSVCLLLWTYVQMPAIAIGSAVSAMAAQNIGAGRWDRIGRIARAGVVSNLLMTGGIIALLLLFDRPVLGLFLGQGSPAIAEARHIQFIASWSFVLFAVTMTLFSVVRANGAVVVPLIILTVGVLGVRVGAAWALLPRMGEDAIWWSFPTGSGTCLVLAALHYLHGGWRRGAPAPLRPPEPEKRAMADAEAGNRLNPAG